MPNLLKELEIIEGVTSYLITLYDESAHLKIGTMNELNTTAKDNLVNAINEVLVDIENGDTDLANKIGALTSLNTTDKSNIVSAINEVLVTLANGDSSLSDSINSLSNTLNDRINDIVTLINNNHIYNVRDYGAKGDGTTDDSVAIQTALSDALNNKGILYFPSGVYISNSILNILQGKGITVLGCGESILKAGSNTTLVKGTHTTNVKLINMIFEGYNSADVPTIDCEFIGSYISGCKFINHGSNTAFLLRNHNNKIVNCEFINDGASGSSALKCGVLGGNDGENWTINNVVHGCYIHSSSIGVHVARQTLAHLQEGLVIDDCIILGTGTGSADGIMIDALFAGTISNCIIDQWGRYGIYFTGTDMNANIKVEGCYLMGKNLPVFAGGGTEQCESIVLDGNTIYSADSNSGIFMNKVSNVIISNNDFNVQHGAFNFAQNAKNIMVVNNVIKAGVEMGTLNSPAGNIVIKDNFANTLAINGTYVTDNPSYVFDQDGHVTITHTQGWTVQFDNNLTIA